MRNVRPYSGQVAVSGVSGGRVGEASLVYRYAVSGSDKSSIDTAVDAPNAGSNDWTNGDLLEIWCYIRTDDAVPVGDAFMIFNNDSGANYNYARMRALNGSVSGAEILGASNIDLWVSSSTNTANAFSVNRITVPNFAGTVGYKAFERTDGIGSAISGDSNTLEWGGYWASTSAISRVGITCNPGHKLKVGSQLLIYKRLTLA